MKEGVWACGQLRGPADRRSPRGVITGALGNPKRSSAPKCSPSCPGMLKIPFPRVQLSEHPQASGLASSFLSG